MLRTYHRWLAIMAAAFLVFIAATGVGLQLDLLIGGREPPGTAPKQQGMPRAMPDRAALEKMTATVFATMAAHKEISVERMEFNFAAPRPFATVGSINRFGPSIRLDLRSGAVLPPVELDVGAHKILQDLHAGYFAGLPGRIISVLSGLALLFLSVTGLKVYVDLYLRRRKIGKKSPFWR